MSPLDYTLAMLIFMAVMILTLSGCQTINKAACRRQTDELINEWKPQLNPDQLKRLLEQQEKLCGG